MSSKLLCRSVTDPAIKSNMQLAQEMANLPEVDAWDGCSSKGLQFWMIFVTICVSVFLSALELVQIFGVAYAHLLH